MAFTAMYEGVCQDCQDIIEPGDIAAYLDGDLLHVECYEEIVLDVWDRLDIVEIEGK